ncbi:MAG: hypothetical protein ACOC0O_06380 [Spirochaetota bacterium]
MFASRGFARACTLLSLLLVAAAPEAQLPEDRVVSDVNWSNGTMRVTVERPVSAEDAAGPTAIARTQRAIRRDATEIIVSALVNLPFDSLHTVSGLLEADQSRIIQVQEAAASARATEATATPDLRVARVSFELDLYADLASHFVTHERPAPLEARLGWYATTDYTGIIVYAGDELPLFGTDRLVELEPTLFPGLYYRQDPGALLFRIAEREHIDPAELVARGPAAYTSDVQATGHADRLGTRPLRILAIGVFGSNPTDVVISESDAAQILASQHNRSLVRDGRVVIVVDPDRL